MWERNFMVFSNMYTGFGNEKRFEVMAQEQKESENQTLFTSLRDTVESLHIHNSHSCFSACYNN